MLCNNCSALFGVTTLHIIYPLNSLHMLLTPIGCQIIICIHKSNIFTFCMAQPKVSGCRLTSVRLGKHNDATVFTSICLCNRKTIIRTLIINENNLILMSFALCEDRLYTLCEIVFCVIYGDNKTNHMLISCANLLHCVSRENSSLCCVCCSV